MENIDFVILWVDGADENWLKEKQKFAPNMTDYNSATNRFRSYDNLQFWFRGVEKFAPWVNNIFFITWGHVPSWLNVESPKIKIIKHEDFIPSEFLPTFNSNVIELNLHRINDLSEHFVLFNDDTFILKKVKPEDFFIDGIPCDEMVEAVIQVRGKKFRIAHTLVNNMTIINENFSKREMIKKHLFKMINIRYGKGMIKAIFLLPYNFYVGFENPHLPQPHLKSTFIEIWTKEQECLNQSCHNKFRGYDDVSHWLMRYWNLCSNMFAMRKKGYGKCFNVSMNNEKIIKYIAKQKGKTICINDVMMIQENDINFEKAKNEIINAFETILPEKSSFEL